ncbi:radical SAM protein, partial [Patescibacteria group bacterium]
IKHYDENPDNLDERTLRYTRGFAVKMADVFLANNKRLSPNVRHKMLNNLANNAIMKGRLLRAEFKEKEGFSPPSLCVMSPTMRCNLSCTGCYAFEYNKSKSGDYSYEVMDRICKEMKSFGSYFMVITGGEPYVRKQDLLRLFREHDDMYFITYTNGTLIDEKTAKDLERVGNVTPCISVEGYQDETDKRRGEGVYDRIRRAMKYLKENGVPFAISITVTKNNAEMVTKDEFIDFWMDKGAGFAWYFQYMPVGKNPDTSLMLSADQRNYVRNRVREIRESDRPFLLADFWGDGILSGGCLAAGRAYLHIGNGGAIEPCVFAQFHVHNIHDTTIREALKSDFFKKYRKAIEDIDDLYRPCGVIDHPENLRKAVFESREKGENVKASFETGENTITTLAPEIDRLAKEREEKVGVKWNNNEL